MAEDYRDHLPCPGTPAEQEIARLRAENAKLTAENRRLRGLDEEERTG